MRQITTRAFLRTLTIIYSSIVMVTLIFSAISYFMVSNQMTSPDASLRDLFVILVPTLLVAGLFAGYFIYKTMLGSVPATAALREKLTRYQTALLVRSACLEIPALFSGVATIVSGELMFLYVPAAIFFIFFALRPTADSIFC
jgi:hypothetical protein